MQLLPVCCLNTQLLINEPKPWLLECARRGIWSKLLPREQGWTAGLYGEGSGWSGLGPTMGLEHSEQPAPWSGPRSSQDPRESPRSWLSLR